MTDGIQLSEVDSYGVMHTEAEIVWSHERPLRHRVRTPQVGDDVAYRHEYWIDPVPGTVTWVQPGDDVDDPHLWRPQLDDRRRPVLLLGKNLMVPRADPWPTVRVKSRYGEFDTREARLRGSPGWLPLDWQARCRPVPEVAPTSSLSPVPLSGAGWGSGGSFIVQRPTGPLGV